MSKSVGKTQANPTRTLIAAMVRNRSTIVATRETEGGRKVSVGTQGSKDRSANDEQIRHTYTQALQRNKRRNRNKRNPTHCKIDRHITLVTVTTTAQSLRS